MANLKQCTRCKQALFCCQDHLAAGWKQHKKYCKPPASRVLEENIPPLFIHWLDEAGFEQMGCKDESWAIELKQLIAKVDQNTSSILFFLAPVSDDDPGTIETAAFVVPAPTVGKCSGGDVIEAWVVSSLHQRQLALVTPIRRWTQCPHEEKVRITELMLATTRRLLRMGGREAEISLTEMQKAFLEDQESVAVIIDEVKDGDYFDLAILAR